MTSAAVLWEAMGDAGADLITAAAMKTRMLGVLGRHRCVLQPPLCLWFSGN